MKKVLSGGGMKGICYTSLLKIFNEYNLYEKIEKYGGSSVGAIYSIIIMNMIMKKYII